MRNPDPAIIWVTATESIPELETLCRELLKTNSEDCRIGL